MNRFIFSFLFILLAGCAMTQTSSQSQVELENYGPAPELTNMVWLNTDHGLRLSDLRGKVVAIDMWTFE